MSVYKRIMSRISEPYRIRSGYGLSPIRTKREMKALIGFCQEELKDKKHMRLNPDRKKIYKDTIYLFNHEGYTPFETKTIKDGDISYYSVDDYIDDHVGWFWN